MCVSINYKNSFLASRREPSFVLNSLFPELSDSCGDVIGELLVREEERERDREVSQTSNLQ